MYYIGIDLGGTNIAAGVVNESCEIIAKGSVPTGRLRPFADIMKDMADLCKKLIADAGISESEVKSIGIASPGTPDVENVKVVYANNLPAFIDAPVGDELKKYFPNVEVYIENDANAAAFGEIIAGAAAGEKDVVVITLGTGVGGGIVIGGKIYAGFNHAGGELGHMVIVADGAPCTCGRCGCWEAYASVTGLIRETAEEIKKYPNSKIHQMIGGDESKISGRTAFDAMRNGDEAGKAIVDQYIKYVGVGTANLINIFEPKKFVIGGGISKEGETLLAPLRKYVDTQIYTSSAAGVPATEIVAAKLGNDAGIIGAAMLFKQDI